MDVSYIPIAKARGFTTHLDNSHAIFDKLEFFTPRCQFYQLFIGYIFTWSVLQQKFKISVDIQPLYFYHFKHCVDYRTGIRSIHVTAKQPFFLLCS